MLTAGTTHELTAGSGEAVTLPLAAPGDTLAHVPVLGRGVALMPPTAAAGAGTTQGRPFV